MGDFKIILDFWFEGLDNSSKLDTNLNAVKKWFMKDDAFDLEIQNRFEEDLKKAKKGEYYFWEETIDGQVALIVIFDQFSRNIYRETPGMFDADPLALKLSLGLIERGEDKKLNIVKRKFVYMPLMHSEDIAIQQTSVESYERLLVDVNQISPQNVSYFENTLSFAKKHFDIVKEFGRFPHRNAILGRESRPEEESFLKKPGSSF